MLVLAMLNSPESSSDKKAFVDCFKKLKVPKGIKVLGTYVVFGVHDAAILYEAPDAETAAKFLTSDIGSFAKIERSLLVPLEKVM
jgi:uncharacterized protein with GYD domain